MEAMHVNTISLEQPVHLRFETDTRYYMMRLEPDLFGDWTLLKAWGGKTNRLGQQRMDHCESYSTASSKLMKSGSGG